MLIFLWMLACGGGDVAARAEAHVCEALSEARVSADRELEQAKLAAERPVSPVGVRPDIDAACHVAARRLLAAESTLRAGEARLEMLAALGGDGLGVGTDLGRRELEELSATMSCHQAQEADLVSMVSELERVRGVVRGRFVLVAGPCP